MNNIWSNAVQVKMNISLVNLLITPLSLNELGTCSYPAVWSYGVQWYSLPAWCYWLLYYQAIKWYEWASGWPYSRYHNIFSWSPSMLINYPYLLQQNQIANNNILAHTFHRTTYLVKLASLYCVVSAFALRLIFDIFMYYWII